MKPLYSFILFLFLISLKTGIAQTYRRTDDLYIGVPGAAPSTNKIAVTMGAASTAGDLIIVSLDWGDNKTVTSVKDNSNAANYTPIGSVTTWNSTWSSQLFYMYNTNGGVTLTITATFSGTPANHDQIYASEFGGMLSASDPLDQFIGAANSTTVINSGSKTTGASNELIYGSSIGAGGTISKGSTYTQASNFDANIIEYKSAAATGSYSADFTNSATANSVAMMATFQTSTSVVLPIELTDFTAQCNTDKVTVNWTTATETNNNYFDIEKSSDAVSFSSIAKITGAGSTSVSHNYKYMDDNPNSGVSYYRLKQTDYNGNSKTFNIISTECEQTANGIFPRYNYQTGGITIDIVGNTAANYSAQLFDVLGKPIISRQFFADKGTTNYNIDLPALHSGIYFISVESGANRTTQKLIVR